MKQAQRVLSTYAVDMFGIASALFELGGLVVMHDASGCNSTYDTHDEPRWYDTPSMVYISGLNEIDTIQGNDQRLIHDIAEVTDAVHPAFIAIGGSPMPNAIGTDFRAIEKWYKNGRVFLRWDSGRTVSTVIFPVRGMLTSAWRSIS